ncbi:MAG: hypothetical protein R2724_26020 [Bryobacterales bacterium]
MNSRWLGTPPAQGQALDKVLVHGAEHATYVAERTCADASGEAVEHPAIWVVFAEFREGRYSTRMPTA